VRTGQRSFDFYPKALVSFYSWPDLDLLEESHHTLWASTLTGTDIRVVDVGAIISVISMQPLPRVDGDPDGLWFVVEKSGLNDVELSGHPDHIDDE